MPICSASHPALSTWPTPVDLHPAGERRAMLMHIPLGCSLADRMPPLRAEAPSQKPHRGVTWCDFPDFPSLHDAATVSLRRGMAGGRIHAAASLRSPAFAPLAHVHARTRMCALRCDSS
jgi:hypothetical protein